VLQALDILPLGTGEVRIHERRGHGADQKEILRFVDHQACNSYYEYSDICDMLDAI